MKTIPIATMALLLLMSNQQALGAISATASGATFPALFIQQTMNAFDGAHSGYQLNYLGGGSGKGQGDLFNNITQFGASDAPLSNAQRTAHPSILHIPETIGSVTLSYTIQNASRSAGCPSPISLCLTKGLNLTATIIAEIYMGNITNWNDAQIKAVNPAWTTFLPNQAITTVHRCDSSGTTFVFTNFLALASPNNWQKNIGNGTTVSWGSHSTPAGVCGSGNAGVASLVAGNPGYAGYVELAYALTNSPLLAYARVNEASDGLFVEPTLASTQNAVNAGAGTLPTGTQSWAHVSLLNESAAYPTYPIASFSYFLVRQEMNTTSSSMTQANLVASYLWYHVQSTGGQSLASGLSFVPLPSNVITIDQNTINLLTYNHASVSHTIPPGTPALSGTVSIALLALTTAAVFVTSIRRKNITK